MATLNRLELATIIVDTLYVNEYFQLPNGAVTNAMVAPSAGIAATKLESYQKAVYAQAGTVATETIVLGIIRGSTGTIAGVKATNVTACAGSSTVTVDVKKNDTTILSAVATLDSSTGALGLETPTVTVTALVANDVLTAVITSVQSGTDAMATGVAVQVDFNEDHPGA